MNKRAILIAGPTASGKSAAALALAEALGGAIVNADSMQVYADLRVLTARPPRADLERADHRLYGHVDAARRHSAGRWLKEAAATAEELWRAGRIPIFTGGTGLYFRALQEGLAPVPEIPASIREEVMAMPREEKQRRARALGIDAGLDAQRLARALMVRLATGRRLEEFHEAAPAAAPLAGAEIIRLFVAPRREILIARIEARFATMLEEGAVEEVKRLLARRLDPSLPVMKAHGVRNIAAALRGEITMDEAARGAITETRQYAKRQMTWARKFMRRWLWCESSEQAAASGLRLAGERDWC